MLTLGIRDVDRDSAKVNNKFLRYNSSTGKWEGADASGGGGGDTDAYLEVANAVPLIANNTTKYLQVSNAAAVVANNTTKYLEVANLATLSTSSRNSSLTSPDPPPLPPWTTAL